MGADTPKTYVIKELSDLLKVPADRRGALFTEIELSLSLAELHGDIEGLDCFEWTDNGEQHQSLFNQNDEEILRLEVTT